MLSTKPLNERFEEFMAMNADVPSADETAIKAEIESIRQEAELLERGVRAAGDRHGMKARELSMVQDLANIGKATAEDVGAAQQEEQTYRTDLEEAQQKSSEVSARLANANRRLVAAREQRLDAYEDQFRDIQAEVAQAAITALWDAVRTVRSVSRINQLGKKRGFQTRSDRYLYGEFIQSRRGLFGYFRQMGEDGFEVPNPAQLKEVLAP